MSTYSLTHTATGCQARRCTLDADYMPGFFARLYLLRRRTARRRYYENGECVRLINNQYSY